MNLNLGFLGTFNRGYVPDSEFENTEEIIRSPEGEFPLPKKSFNDLGNIVFDRVVFNQWKHSGYDISYISAN